jgi:hypothetical protein
MATWVIRSKTCTSRMIMTFLPCLQTKEGECNIVTTQVCSSWTCQRRENQLKYSYDQR